MNTMKWAGTVLVVLGLAGCTTHPTREVRIVEPTAEAQAAENVEIQRVVDGVRMIGQGHIQAAIDGPLDEVVHHYEAQYQGHHDVIFSARGVTDALLYSTLGADGDHAAAVRVIGPAWAMAYWGRGYAFDEMARYDDAIVELKKALALAPFDAQYNIEIGFAYQRKRAWAESLKHYEMAEDYASATTEQENVPDVTCKALRGRGYDLVELHRYKDARAAYRRCLELVPGEPRSLGELKYIDQVAGRESPR